MKNSSELDGVTDHMDACVAQIARAILSRLVLLAALAQALACAAADQRAFATPEAAVEALVAALKANDEAALFSIFGSEHRGLVATGDAAQDAVDRAEAVAQVAAFRVLAEPGPDRRVLLMGVQAWPFPIPLVRQGGTWRFATEEGADELLNRRIGDNERNAIYVLRAYLDAQRQYATRDRNGDGVLQYARSLASSPGRQDGLYWDTDESKGGEASPFGPLVAESVPSLKAHEPGTPYHGYHFRILTRQGGNAAGGAYNYIANGRMIAGFAMVAYPAQYGQSGVMTFVVSHNGKVYEKDLGKGTAGIGAKMSAFDPGPGWGEVVP